MWTLQKKLGLQLYFIMLFIFKASTDIMTSMCMRGLFKSVILFSGVFRILWVYSSYLLLGKVLSSFQRWLDLALIIFRQRKERKFLMRGTSNICASFMHEALYPLFSSMYFVKIDSIHNISWSSTLFLHEPKLSLGQSLLRHSTIRWSSSWVLQWRP